MPITTPIDNPVQVMSDLYAYMLAHQDDGSSSFFLLSPDHLVRNSMHAELGRGGYFEPFSSTSEGMALMIRAMAHAHITTGDGYWLTEAKKFADAAIRFNFFAVEPPAAGNWDNHWLISARPDAFDGKGPSSPEGPAFDGVIAQENVFVDGVTRLPASLANVYQVFSRDGKLRWANVHAPGTEGTWYDIDRYVDRERTVYAYDAAGNVSAAHDAAATPGELRIKDTGVSGTLRVNYSVFDPRVKVPYGSAYEAWPMWHPIGPDGAQAALDSIHWFVDAFDLMAKCEPANGRWSMARNAMLRMWQAAMVIPGDEPFAFRKAPGKEYNAYPMTFFSYRRGGESIEPPEASAVLSFARDSAGMVEFILPEDVDRTLFEWKNQELFLHYSSPARLDVEIAADATCLLTARIWSADSDENHEASFYATPEVQTLAIPFAAFLSYSGVAAAWRPDDGSYAYGGAETAVAPHRGIACRRIVLPPSSGLGFAAGPLGWTGSDPPTISYATNDTGLLLVVRDAAGWNWQLALPVRSSFTELALSWSSVTIAAYQQNTGTPPASPDTGGPIQVVQVQNDTGSPATVWVRYVATAPAATLPVSGPIRQVSLQYSDTAARTLRIGDVRIVNGWRDAISYRGAALFNYSPVGRQRAATAMLSGAPWMGPMYPGYQQPAPWLSIGGNAGEYIANTLALMRDAQDAYQASTGVSGPFAPVFVPETWDATAYGAPGTFTWNGPDPNTFWGGFQYRAFEAMADFWLRLVSRNAAPHLLATVGGVVNRFMVWLDGWLTAHPSAAQIPTTFHEGAIPVAEYAEPHMIALALRGVLKAGLAGHDETMVDRVAGRLGGMLMARRVNVPGAMYGSFSPDPAKRVDYGYWVGEILETLALVASIESSSADRR